MPPRFTTRVFRAALLCGIADAVWAMALTVEAGRPPLGVWRNVASVALGAESTPPGGAGIAIGLLLHFAVATAWATVFASVESGWPRLRRFIARPSGVAVVAAIYGPLVWVLMSAVVIPAMTGNMLVVSPRWFLQLAGHAIFVGLPIVLGARGFSGGPVSKE